MKTDNFDLLISTVFCMHNLLPHIASKLVVFVIIHAFYSFIDIIYCYQNAITVQYYMIMIMQYEVITLYMSIYVFIDLMVMHVIMNYY